MYLYTMPSRRNKMRKSFHFKALPSGGMIGKGSNDRDQALETVVECLWVLFSVI